MSRYAESTSVPADRSRAEIERTLTRYGADQFLYGWERGRAIVAFTMASRQIKFVLPMPDRNSKDFQFTPTGRERSAASAEAAFDQAVRQHWRALALVIKAKLEAVESGIVTFEQEFGMHFTLPDGHAVHEWLLPQIAEAYETGHMPPLLPQPARQIGAR